MVSGTEYVLVVRSVTSAMRGQKLLEREGIRATIQRSTNTSQRGCGYTIKVKADPTVAVNILRSAEIDVLEIRR